MDIIKNFFNNDTFFKTKEIGGKSVTDENYEAPSTDVPPEQTKKSRWSGLTKTIVIGPGGTTTVKNSGSEDGVQNGNDGYSQNGNDGYSQNGNDGYLQGGNRVYIQGGNGGYPQGVNGGYNSGTSRPSTNNQTYTTSYDNTVKTVENPEYSLAYLAPTFEKIAVQKLIDEIRGNKIVLFCLDNCENEMQKQQIKIFTAGITYEKDGKFASVGKDLYLVIPEHVQINNELIGFIRKSGLFPD